MNEEKKSTPVPFIPSEVNDVFLNLCLTHAMPKNLLVDEIVRIGSGTLSAVSDVHEATKNGVEGGAHG